MKKINGNILTEKGMVKTEVRKGIVESEEKAILNLGFEKVDNKAIYTREYVDNNGKIAYATLELRVSNTNPRDLAPKTRKKSSTKEKETFEIVED